MNRITDLLHIKYPIIQAGMIWCSGWKLASAVSNAGALGIIGAGSMHPNVLEEHIVKCKNATSNPFGINVPLLYSELETLFEIIIRHEIKVVITSAGNPAKWTDKLHEQNITVIHVVANQKSALKCQQAGVDAIVAEGFEAGGHNGKEETTTMTLIPLIRECVDLPLIAAGGIADGASMLAAFALGAEGVQVGSRFVASEESSAHPDFKRKVIQSSDGDTMLRMKKVVPVRLLKNDFEAEIANLESQGATESELRELLGHGRAKKGMFEGNMEEGELEIGQVAANIHNILPASVIIENMMKEFEQSKQKLSLLNF